MYLIWVLTTLGLVSSVPALDVVQAHDGTHTRPYSEAYLKATSVLMSGARKTRRGCHLAYRETVKGIARAIGMTAMISSIPRLIIHPPYNSIWASAYYEGECVNDAALNWMVGKAPLLYHTAHDCREFGIEPWCPPSGGDCVETVSRLLKTSRYVLALVPTAFYLGARRAARATSLFLAPVVSRAAKRSYQTLVWTIGPSLPTPSLPTPSPVPAPISMTHVNTKYASSWNIDRDAARDLYLWLCGRS